MAWEGRRVLRPDVLPITLPPRMAKKPEQTKGDASRDGKEGAVLDKKLKRPKPPRPTGHPPARRPMSISREWHRYKKSQVIREGKDQRSDVAVPGDHRPELKAPSPYWVMKRDGGSSASSSASSASSAFWLEDCAHVEQGRGQPAGTGAFLRETPRL